MDREPEWPAIRDEIEIIDGSGKGATAGNAAEWCRGPSLCDGPGNSKSHWRKVEATVATGEFMDGVAYT